jgi:hypothetical protein
VSSRTGLDAVAKRISCPCREWNPGPAARSLVIILTKLHQLLLEHKSCSRELSFGSSVSIVTRIRAGRPGFDSRQGMFFCLPPRPAGYGAHPVSYPVGTGDKAVGT